MIVYEYPLNERVRTWLRLEDLFDKVLFFIRAGDARSHHTALLALFELVEVLSRPELRTEIIHELDRQKTALEALRGNPAVDGARLDDVLHGLGSTLQAIHLMNGRPGQHVRDNEWLGGIRSRTGIPGGACSFDLPGYHYWLNTSDNERESDLRGWLDPILPIQEGVAILLTLLRESGSGGHHVAPHGLFQMTMAGRVAHLMRVEVGGNLPCAPEVSANKYAVNIRFTAVDKAQKPRVCDEDIAFNLTFCSLGGCCA